jgi:leucyl aminopeptidase
MSTTAKPAFSLHLIANNGDLPSGTTVRTHGDARAVVSLGDAISATVALPNSSRAETRWIVDQVVRRIESLAPFGSATLTAADAVDDDTLMTIALDLQSRTLGKSKLQGRDSVDAAVARAAGYETGYRDWVNEDPSTRTSLAIARDVIEWAAGRDHVETTVLAEPELETKGLRLLLAVGQGSEVSPARLVLADYSPPGAEGEPLMLLGKGITFDTGGINVKPYDAFVSMMKNDMAGAALAFHLFRALVESDHKRRIILAIPTCENAVGARSMRPGAVVKSYRGHEVKVDHTDAEGRLVLVDALAYAADTYKPSQVISFATLTTSALIAYGPYATPIHFASKDLEARLSGAGEAMGEDLHFFPERIWHSEANRDKEADFRNTARLPGHAVRGAGSRNAAHFLRQFTDVPLCHFDIFGSTWNWSGEAPGARYGATGAPLGLLARTA